MNAVAIAESVSAITLVVGVVFAMVQLRQNSERQQRDSAIELVHSFKTPEFSRALYYVYQLPTGLNDGQIRQRMGDNIAMISSLASTWEAFGILIFRGDIGIDLFEDFFSGPVLYSWAALRDFVEETHKHTRRNTNFEWFQWLAERVADRKSSEPPIPAHIQHREWHPKTRKHT